MIAGLSLPPYSSVILSFIYYAMLLTYLIFQTDIFPGKSNFLPLVMFLTITSALSDIVLIVLTVSHPFTFILSIVLL